MLTLEVSAAGRSSHISSRGAMGVAATHNLGLTTLAVEQSGRAENAHFTHVLVDGELAFDYRLRPGVVQTSNALHLISKLGIDVHGAADELFDWSAERIDT